MSAKDAIKKIIELCLIIFFSLIILPLLFYYAKYVPISMRVVVVFSVFCLLGVFIFIVLTKKNCSKPITTLVLCGFAFFICALYCFSVRLSYEGDLAFYLQNAQKITNNELTKPLMYHGVFPHTVTYPAFLSVFMHIFGTSEMVPIVINIIVTSLSAGLVFLYASMFLPYKWSVAAALVTGVNPYLWIYSNTVNAELIFGFLCIFSLYIYRLGFSKKSFSTTQIILFFSSFILCSFANFFRPVSLILLIAFCLHFFIYSKESIFIKGSFIAAFSLIFFIFGIITGMVTNNIIGYLTPKNAYGWNLYVGASETGRWNQKDADEFNEVLKSAKTPDDVQGYFSEKAWERYKNMGINTFGHLFKKLNIWMRSEYLVTVAERQVQANSLFRSNNMEGYRTMIFIYDSAVKILGFLGCLFVPIARKKQKKEIGAEFFYFAGSILLFMLMESTFRYTVSYQLFLPIFSIMLLQLIIKVFIKNKDNELKPEKIKEIMESEIPLINDKKETVQQKKLLKKNL